MERIPKPGEFYRHFKDKLYQIIAIATHSETGEAMVVYQALYGDFGVYVRPLSMFVSQVDHEKYPDVKQKYRFEKADMAQHQEMVEEQPSQMNPLLLPFVEAESFEQKLEILAAMRGKIGQEELDILYVALDLPQRGGDCEEQLDAIEKYIEMQIRFSGSRLR